MKIRQTKTEAAFLVAQNKPLVIDTIELPKTLEVGQVLVELVCSGICGSQLGEIDGVKGPDKYLPHLMGMRDMGKYSRLGPESGNFQKGIPLCCIGDPVLEFRAKHRDTTGEEGP